MRHKVTNTGPTPLNVYDRAGDSTRVEPGTEWQGELWKIHNVISGRVAYSVQPVEE